MEVGVRGVGWAGLPIVRVKLFGGLGCKPAMNKYI